MPKKIIVDVAKKGFFDLRIKIYYNKKQKSKDYDVEKSEKFDKDIIKLIRDYIDNTAK